MAVKPGSLRRLSQTLGAVRTGVILLILVGVVSAAGTVILQRPATNPEEMERVYSATTLRILDAAGLTDVYHTWWYLLLLGLLATSIIFASIERWPNAWRYYSRPYRRTDPSFRAVLPLRRSIPVDDPAKALDTAERVWKQHGLKAERIVEHDEVSLYAEKSRFAVLAVYVVHASLLLIMLGGIIDGIWGYKGYLMLVPGKPAIQQLELRDGSLRSLPFGLRCLDAGQENYTGEFSRMPKRYWSKLAVVENGHDVLQKEIAVNDPLTYRGVRFFQSGYGTSGELRGLRLAAVQSESMDNHQAFKMAVNDTVQLADGTSVRLAKFLPDAYVMDGDIYQRSRDLDNAAAKLELTKAGKTQTAFLFRSSEAGMGDVALEGPYDVQQNPLPGIANRFVAILDMAPYTGLQVSHQPGESLIWAGCVLMAGGLILAFWVLHQRYWAVATKDKEGRLVLWMGATANKKRESFDERFQQLADEIGRELNTGSELARTSVGGAQQS